MSAQDHNLFGGKDIFVFSLFVPIAVDISNNSVTYGRLPCFATNNIKMTGFFRTDANFRGDLVCGADNYVSTAMFSSLDTLYSHLMDVDTLSEWYMSPVEINTYAPQSKKKDENLSLTLDFEVIEGYKYLYINHHLAFNLIFRGSEIDCPRYTTAACLRNSLQNPTYSGSRLQNLENNSILVKKQK